MTTPPPAPRSDAATADFEKALQLFRDVVDPTLLDTLQPSAPQAIYTTWVTVWLLVYQRLHSNATLQSAVAALLEFVGDISTNKRVTEGTLSANTGAFSHARTRLEVEVAQAAADHVFTSLLPPKSSLLGDRHIVIPDGTTLALDAQAELREAWPGATNQHGASAWPIVHVAVMHELETGLAMRPEVGVKFGPKAESEVALAIRMLPRIPAKSVLLADRGFGIFGFVHAAVEAGHDTLTRLTESRFRSMVRSAREMRPGVWELRWKPSKKDRKTFGNLPVDAAVVVYLYEFSGCEGKPMWVASTVKLTVQQVSSIYARRYEVEWDIRQWKHQLGMASLRGRSVDMVLKELAMGAIAYNLVVEVRRLAAERGGVPAKRLSFSGVWSLVEVLLLGCRKERSAAEWTVEFDRVLKYCLQRKLPKRPGRSYPRQAYAKRGSNFPTRGRPPEANTVK